MHGNGKHQIQDSRYHGGGGKYDQRGERFIGVYCKKQKIECNYLFIKEKQLLKNSPLGAHKTLALKYYCYHFFYCSVHCEFYF